MEIQVNVSLSDKNWFQTGGKARFFCEPTTAEEFSYALNFAQKQSLELFVLGQGANILISDSGFEGLVIRPQLKTVVFNDTLVTAGAGVDIDDLIASSLNQQLIGLEEFSGIPGSVGGAVYINIHYFQFLLSNFLVSAHVINAKNGAVMQVDPAWFQFGYDQSALMASDYYLVDATFQLKKVDALQAAYAQGRSVEIIRHRRQRYPYANTCGSFFRNFHDHEVPFLIEGKKILFVAYYLDKLGVKGVLRVGNAIVSYQHANMIVTQPGATSTDVVMLVQAMQQKVYDAYGIVPQAECQMIGFKQFPLISAMDNMHDQVQKAC